MRMDNFRKIAVLMGGVSNEREVSLDSGDNVARALESLGGYEVKRVILDSEELPDLTGIDAVFLALHGGWGENGGVQAALDAIGMPYTGPGSAASQIAMDKIATKRIFDSAGIPTAPWAIVTDREEKSSPIPLPSVVKPPKDGSSVGITCVRTPEDWPSALKLAIDTDGREALVEKYIPGREMTVGILPGAKALPVIEIVTLKGWYGYEEKYLTDTTQFIFPNDDFLPELQKIALRAYEACGCRGVSRVDFRVQPDGKAFVLELNTLPGMTAHSLVPKACAKIGLTFADMCETILKAATHD